MADFIEEEVTFTADGNTLHGVWHAPKSVPSNGISAVVVLHGFPSPAVGADRAGVAYASMASRITEEVGCGSLAFTYRGCGESEGNFSVNGWRADATAAVQYVAARPDVKETIVVGFGTGGAMAICVTADLELVQGVAAVSPPADFSDWAADPAQLLDHCRQLGLVNDEAFPGDFDAWAAEIKTASAADHAGRVAPRPLLLIHGSDDEIVPVFDTRVIADMHGEAEMRLLTGAGHGLRFDPRAVAILLGWLDRQT